MSTDNENTNDKIKLRQLLELASSDFSPKGFSDEQLEETKELLKKYVGSRIEYFTQGLPFGISQPEFIENDNLKFKAQSKLGMVILIVDKNGNIY